MAINVNVISENNAFNVENASYCTVALPITSCWGPGFTLPTNAPASTEDPALMEDALENTAWRVFDASASGLESFIATYRGPSSNYRSTKDYSYFMALTLLNAGYAVQTCRLCPGTNASISLPVSDTSGSGSTPASGSLVITAKYPGTFGNCLKVSLKKKVSGSYTYWNLVGYAVDANGTSRAVENLVFVLDPKDSTDSIVSIDELQSNFFTFKTTGTLGDFIETPVAVRLEGGSDVAYADPEAKAKDILDDAKEYAKLRYGKDSSAAYIMALDQLDIGDDNISAAEAIRFNEWVYSMACGAVEGVTADLGGVYDLLRDKINYNPNRIIAPWDDQDILAIDPDYDISTVKWEPSPLTQKILDVAASSRCATAYIDVPRSLPRSKVWDETLDPQTEAPIGYAQKLATLPKTVDDPLYASNGALFAPWGQYTYAGTTRQATATPSFMALLIDRAMIKNQAVQYEWALPTTRSNNVRLGKLAYTVPKRLLDNWQGSEGARVNTITSVPSLGTTIWGNATLFDVPPATYQALQNLSTRKLINAVKDTVFKIGIGIEFQYNGQEAYAKFYAGVTPLLDTMRNVGAIEDYKVQMAADINNVDSINANSVVGTIYLVIAGVIENITVDLIALPQGTDLSNY